MITKQHSWAARLKVSILCLCGALAAEIGAAPAVSGTAGIYGSTDNNYRIEVKFGAGKLVVIEPNKTSEYTQRPDASIYDFKNPTNGISYVLEVAEGGKALKAYKPGTPDDFTPLKLIKAAAPNPPAQAAAGVEKIPVENPQALHPDLVEPWGIRKIEGVTLEGRYTLEGEAHPYIQLSADGKGVFEMHGAPKPEHVYQINWWIQANADGTLIKTDHPAATQYMLVVEYVDKPYQGDKFDRLNLAVEKAEDGRDSHFGPVQVKEG